jgi:signal transduction histidine kinase
MKMQIKKRLRINTVISMLLAFVVTFVLILSLYRINNAKSQLVITDEIINLALERIILGTDYILNNSERAKTQVFAKNKQIDKLLNSAPEHYQGIEERKIIDAMIEVQHSGKEIFSTIVANRENSNVNDGSTNFSLLTEERLLTQLNMRTYKTVIQGRALKESGKKALASALRAAGWCTLIVMIIIAVAMINAWNLSRIITDRITRLLYGAEMIGSGKLDHRINITGNDEFAEFAEAFNTMTAKISDLLHDLEVESREHKHAKEALQVLNDLLETKIAQRTFELQETQQQYLHAAKLSTTGQLSSSIAHEINTPLQGVVTILSGLKKRAILAEEDKELLDLAIEENMRMKTLIRNLQDFNRPTAGRKVTMDVHASLDTLLLFYRSDFKRKKISTVLNYADGLPQVQAIPDQIKQVFLNLLMNAADACQEHGRVITISTWQVKQKIAVAIKDNGIGIEPEKLNKIFQPFYSTKSKDTGLGLGLSICLDIIQNHCGEIRVTSQPNDGTTFTVLLPIYDE